MSRAFARGAAFAAFAALLALPGCYLLEQCPPYVSPMGGDAWSTARLDLANASAAVDALKAVGFDAVTRDGLLVEGSQGTYHARLMPDGNRTWLRLTDEALSGEFRSGEAAQRFIEQHRAGVTQRVNATVGALNARLGWPPFELAPFEAAIAVC